MKASIIIFIVLITLKLYPQPISFNPVMLVADNHEGAAKIALILDALDQPYTMYTDSALQFITVREWRHFDAVLWIGLVTNAEEESCKAYLNGGGNLLVMDNDAAYDLSIGNIFLEGYLMAKYIRDSGSDTIIRGTDLMEGL